MSQRSIPSSQSMRIEFPPDPRAIGLDNPNFSRLCDAVAEFVDNAIQACADPDFKRIIKVHLYLPPPTMTSSKSSSGFLVIADHGKGMNTTQLTNFATFALSREERGEMPVDGDRTFIGKFGVGAKQGGFYLGDRIRVLTKSVHTSATDPWWEFTLDAGNLRERARNRENVYTGVLQSFTNPESILAEDELEYTQLVNDIRAHMDDEADQGAIFIVRLKRDKALELGKDYKLFEHQLAEIHHFHLHPEHQPSISVSKRQIFSDGSAERAPFDIHFVCHRGSSMHRSSLQQVLSFPRLCFEQASPQRLEFALGVPGSVEGSTYRITGVVMYFPFTNGVESRPPSLLDNDEAPLSDVIIRVAWQDRALPEALLSSLPFFPPKGDVTKLVDSGMTSKWKSRIVIFLFFDWNFQQISNNKLKITIPHFEKHLQSLHHSIQYHPANLKRAFGAWLIECSKLDQEFRFSNRVREVSAGNVDTSKTFFRALSVQGSEQEFVQGGRVCIKVTGSNARESEHKIFAVIKDFVVREALPLTETSFIGTGSMRYQRIPEKLFGDKSYDISLSKCSLSQISPADLNAFAADSTPTHLELYLLESDKSPLAIANESTAPPLRCGLRYSFGVKLTRGKNKETFHPDGVKDLVYGVELEVGKAGQSITSSVAKSHELVSDPMVSKLKYIVMRDVVFTTPGKMDITVRVKSHDFEQSIMDKTFSFRLVTSAPKRFVAGFGSVAQLTQAALAESNTQQLMPSTTSAPTVRLGQGLPAIYLVLLDVEDRPISFEGTIKVTLQCDSLQINADNDDIEYVKAVATSGRIKIPANYWQIAPKNTRMHLFDRNTSRSRLVSLTIAACLMGASSTMSASQSNRWKDVGHVSVEVELCPGMPRSLSVIAPDPVRLKVGEDLPSLQLQCLDEWGNETAPVAGDDPWKVVLDEGPLKMPSRSRPVVVSDLGEIVLQNLLCTADTLVLCELSQMLHLVEGVSGAALAGCPPQTIKIFVAPEAMPSKVEILYQGRVLSESDFYDIEVGGTIEGLSFCVRNELNAEVDLAPYRDSPDSKLEFAMFEVDRVASRKKKKILLPADNALNPVKGPTVAKLFHMEITFTLAKLELKATVQVRVRAGPPRKWKILTQEGFDKGLLLNSAEDLQAKFLCVLPVDAYGNETDHIDSSLTQASTASRPLMRFASSAQNKESHAPAHEIHFTLKRKRIVMPGSQVPRIAYLLPETAMLTGFAPETVLRITAESSVTEGAEEPESIEECELLSKIVGADPATLSLSSNHFELISVDNVFLLELSPFEACDDLEISVLDENGGIASSNWTKKMTLSLFHITQNSLHNNSNDNDREKSPASALFSKKGLRTNPLKLDFAISVQSLGGLEALSTQLSQQARQLAASQHTGGGSRDLFVRIDLECCAGKETKQLSATLQLAIVRSNHVIGLVFRSYDVSKPLPPAPEASDAMDVVKTEEDDAAKGVAEDALIRFNGTDFELDLVAGDPLPGLLLHTVTADGAAYKADRSHVKATLKPTHCRDLVRVVDRSDCHALEIAVQNFKQHLADTFRLECKYEEKRANLQSMPAQLRHVSAALNIRVHPNVLQGLRLDEKKIAKEMLHALPEKDRTFARQLTLAAVDAYNNPVSWAEDEELRLLCYIEHVNADVDGRKPLPLLEGGGDLRSGMDSDSDSEGQQMETERDTSDIDSESPSDDSDVETMLQRRKSDAAGGGSQKRKRADGSGSASKTKRPKNTSLESAASRQGLRAEIELQELVVQLQAVQARVTKTRLFSFATLRLANPAEISTASQAQTQPEDGDYRLVFRLVRLLGGRQHLQSDVARREVLFHYSSRRTVEFESRRIISAGETALHELNSIRSIEQEKRTKEDALNVLRNDSGSSEAVLKLLGRGPSATVAQELEVIEQNSSRSLQQMELQAEHTRPAKRESRFVRNHLPEGALGFVVDLACVAEENEAQILAWAAGNWLDTIVAANRDQAVALYKKSQRAWAPDTGTIHHLLNSSGSSSSGPSRHHSLQDLQVGGNPRYMVDILQLDADREGLRNTLFQLVFQNMVLIDTLDDALILRQRLKERGQRHPTIYTLTGDRIPSSGLLDPTMRPPTSFQCVFGAQDVRKGALYAKTQRLLQDAQRAAELCREIAELQAQLPDDGRRSELERAVRTGEAEKRRLRIV